MNSINELKQQLIDIKANDWKLPEKANTYELVLKAMESIGTTDQELRDELVLEFVFHQIVEKVLTPAQLRELMDICLSDEHLFYKLGSKDDDSVFNRAFTVLVVRWIVYYHTAYGEDLYSEDEMKRIFAKLIDYVRNEMDTRGYVEGKGWAHAIAHSGDALRGIALCNYLKSDELLMILEVIKEKVCISSAVFINEEAERLVSAAVNAIERGIMEEAEVIAWMNSFYDAEKPEENYPIMHYWKENVKDFLRSLYFRLKFRKAPEIYLNEIEKVLNIINERMNNVKI